MHARHVSKRVALGTKLSGRRAWPRNAKAIEQCLETGELERFAEIHPVGFINLDNKPLQDLLPMRPDRREKLYVNRDSGSHHSGDGLNITASEKGLSEPLPLPQDPRQHAVQEQACEKHVGLTIAQDRDLLFGRERRPRENTLSKTVLLFRRRKRKPKIARRVDKLPFGATPFLSRRYSG